MAKDKNPIPAPEEIVAVALNEQGYLLQHKVVDVLLAHARTDPSARNWSIDATEVPVSLPNEDETRIDLILRRGQSASGPWRIVVECKRAARDYKKWVFFGETTTGRPPSPNCYYVEKAELLGSWMHSDKPPSLTHQVVTCPVDEAYPVFEYGVEVRMNKPSREQRTSATTSIEDAFQQVLLGQTGLMLRLRTTNETNIRMIPLVITTAELLSAHFAAEKVSGDKGMIDPSNLRLGQRRWLAVNVRMNDVVFKFSPNTTNRNMDLAMDIASRQVRTVFVTQAQHLKEFLAWLDALLIAGQL
jgi:hypothetical protein